MAAAMLASFAACGKKEPSKVPQEGGYDAGGNYVPAIPDVSKELGQAIKDNSDVVGWLQLPDTKINEPVVQTTDNEYYLRRDYKKNYSYAGCYYLDYESVLFDEGKDLPQNAIIYGHNLGNPLGTKDDPEADKFAQLLKFDDVEFAKKTPYIYFTTPGGQHVFEIFAVFYCEADMTPVPYHLAEYTDERLNMLLADVRARSMYSYDVEVTPEDKILTLSTCSYKYGAYSQNPDQRYVVMGRLVRDGEGYHEQALLKINETPKAPAFLNTAA
ncbi:class B sortase [Anaerotruncus sp.]|uniref:class B sortase n=1 Tax=Anaerotruncus sp. TaxID=1872531 RepID=UPI0025BC63E4|nr:class B sortase [Anaerotruncus sp.]